MRRAATLAMLLAVAACDGGEPSLNRMIDQEKGEPYEASPFFADGRVMRTPPEGTVPRGRIVGDPALTEGVLDGRLVERIPIDLTADLVARGRNRYDVFCAPCHGLLGDGKSEVARQMTLRPPPSLVDLLASPPAERVRDQGSSPGVDQGPLGDRYAPGGLFRTITLGFGLMPSYGAELSVGDRWAVVAYVQALALSQRARLDELPPALRDEAIRALEGEAP